MSEQTNKNKESIWNLPNALTVFRIILIIPFTVLLLGGQRGWFGSNLLIPDIIADLIFIIASLTDMLDGKIARRYGLVSNFGKFMDPLADKLLVCTAMIALIDMKRIPAWVVIIIIAREFIISGFRLIAVENGKVIAASWWGKFKTTFQMIMVILMIVEPILVLIGMPVIVVDIIMYIALALTIVSLIDYLVKNRSVLK
ncbi:MAG: CDP-diacylglycerol--glycerol-3-phosphate 3-phosphatidyltransferase [Lachnospiraceae bacterium]|nr:CDP-diacylglycerol--glycerol-3-phosphate 3-phosphatidyltransferase [Lachnospiraceae bacterium]MBO7363028.1 CDP-diacylglycerol--glycerol-3-phosphate 3-phosphatidyltransferase [Lachnospiraceae bacterium]MBP5253125.1 CDP-diacylglycerol--glycerol-3-phosphate 3-phosphatidyltransferase [Lachnospiraceae bacterium]MBP5471325.1 CDP-diacylglycerol--glycerol-3-phosphate 3-phosphatidyltransferase [Lachnospiraceae bacterium]MBP5702221.1 CDP-diacylglycerol--glycerol-3-phosphate 3-phosphatidyltransferase [